jgi:hypothetical protein
MHRGEIMAVNSGRCAEHFAIAWFEHVRILALLCGLLAFAVIVPPCHAQETGPSYDVLLPKTEADLASKMDVLPILAPQSANSPGPRATDPKAVKAPEVAWYWRFLEMLAISAAKYNTEKQSDGRPLTGINF